MKSTIQNAEQPTGALGLRGAVPVPIDAKWISAKQVCNRYGGRSLMWLNRKLANDPQFPRPTFFGHLRYWQPTALDDYDRKIVERQLVEGKPKTRRELTGVSA